MESLALELVFADITAARARAIQIEDSIKPATSGKVPSLQGMSTKLKAKMGETFNALSADQQQQVLSKVAEVSPNTQSGSKNQVTKIHAMSIQLSNGTSLDWKDSSGKRKHDGSGEKNSSKKGAMGSKGKKGKKGKGKDKGAKGSKGKKGKGGSKGGDGSKAPAEGLCKIMGCSNKVLWNYKQKKYKMVCFDCNKKSDSGEELRLYNNKEWWTKAKRDEFYADKNGNQDSSKACAGEIITVMADGSNRTVKYTADQIETIHGLLNGNIKQASGGSAGKSHQGMLIEMLPDES